MAGAPEAIVHPWVAWLALLMLCSAYLQGGWDKLRDFPAAVAEMRRFGLGPAPLWAAAVIALEVGASVLVLTGWFRWLGALVLAGFTLLANLLADRFWSLPPGARRSTENAFFEHCGLAGGLLLVAWLDLGGRLVR